MKRATFILLLAAFSLAAPATACGQVVYIPQETQFVAPKVPAYIEFAGQTYRFDRPDLYERMDRELVAFTYGHTNSVLMLKRAERMFSRIVPILKKNGVPEDLKYLMAIECNLDPKSVSSAGAAGPWQFLKATAQSYGLEVNDNVDVALAMGADGIHVGQHDMEAGDVRALLGPDKILGVSAQTVEQAVLAEQRGADYLGVGAVFPTGSKDDADDVSHETLKAICDAVSIPVVAIGGISQQNVRQLAGSGICGIAVISAIFAQKDIKAATALLKETTMEMLNE